MKLVQNYAVAACCMLYSAGTLTTVFGETHTDYTTDQRILNSSDTYTGTTTVTAEVGARQGAIDVRTAGVTTTIEGTLHIKSNTSESTSQYPIGISSSANGGVVNVKTITGTDRVLIDVYGPVGTGIRATGGGVVNIDVSSYTGEGAGAVLNIWNSTAADKTEEAALLEATGNGIINAKGVFELNAVQDRGYGMWTSGSAALNEITGSVNITTKGAGGYGIRADGGITRIVGNISIDTQSTAASSGYYSHGIRICNDAKVYVTSDATIKTAGSSANGLSSDRIGTLNPVYPTSDAYAQIQGKLDITTTGSSAKGIYNVGGTFDIDGEATIKTVSHGVNVNATADTRVGVINLNNTTVLETTGASGYGIYAQGAYGTVNANSLLTITTQGANGHGIYAYSGGTANINGKTDISMAGNTANAFYSSGVDAVLNVNTSDISISASGTGKGHAFYSYNGGVININDGLDNKLAWRDVDGAHLIYAYGGTVNAKEGKYNLEGSIYSESYAPSFGTKRGSVVDMVMTDASYYKGKTTLVPAADSSVPASSLDLKFKNGSTWENLVESSSLTSAAFEDSKLIMTLESTTNFSNLVLVDFSGDADSIIKIILADGFAPEFGDEFLIVNATGDILYTGEWDFDDATLEGELFWDTSTFALDGTIRVGQPIPEPATLALIFGLSAGILAIRSRRSKS